MELGDIIKQRRKELGMTQKELADNICTQALISRIENNDVIPKKDILDQFEERLQLGNSELNIVFSLNTNQNKIDELTAEIREFLAKREYKSIELLLKYNQDLIKSCKDIDDISFFKWMEASVAHQVHEESDKALEILKDISLTEVDNEISIEIMNAIGLIYYQKKDLPTAISYFYSGMQYIDDSVNYKIQAKILFNYALALEENDQDVQALSILISGIESLLKNDSLYLLGDFYYMKGYIFDKQNNYQEAIENFELAQTIFKIQNNNRFYDYAQISISEMTNKMHTDNR